MSDEFHKIYRKDNLDLELQLYFYGGIKMKGISNTRGISNGKLEHIFWGTVNGEKLMDSTAILHIEMKDYMQRLEVIQIAEE